MPLLLQSLSAAEQSSGTPSKSQSVLVPLAMSVSSGTPFALQSGALLVTVMEPLTPEKLVGELTPEMPSWLIERTPSVGKELNATSSPPE